MKTILPLLLVPIFLSCKKQKCFDGQNFPSSYDLTPVVAGISRDSLGQGYGENELKQIIISHIEQKSVSEIPPSGITPEFYYFHFGHRIYTEVNAITISDTVSGKQHQISNIEYRVLKDDCDKPYQVDSYYYNGQKLTASDTVFIFKQ